MERLKRLVATHGNGFALSEPFSATAHLPPVATGCERSAPERLHRRLSSLATGASAERGHRLGGRSSAPQEAHALDTPQEGEVLTVHLHGHVDEPAGMAQPLVAQLVPNSRGVGLNLSGIRLSVRSTVALEGGDDV